MLPRFTLGSTALALLISIVTGLYHRFSAPATEVPVPVGIVIARADTSAWNLGTEHAVAFIRECADDYARGLRLLDIRARESNIRARIGESGGGGGGGRRGGGGGGAAGGEGPKPSTRTR
ncbi:MAG: hypothetical protein K2L63_01250, partial [Paramuribaculum sp.]|nr:hypothetical protein [Paramuribaculum sp.]